MSFPGLVLDLIDGARASHHIQNGWDISVGAIVSGLEFAEGPVTTMMLFEAALEVIIAAVGDRGSACPNVSVPTYLESFVPEAITMQEVKVRIIYKGYPSQRIEFTSASNQVESNLDADGNLITVKYKYPTKYLLDPRKAGQTVTQGGMVSRPLPQICLNVHFTVISFGDFAGTLAAVTDLLQTEGCVNASAYPIGTLVGKPRTWMITAVRAVTKNGDTYEMTLTMEYRLQGWDPQVTFINPDDGKPPPDLIKGTGTKTPKVPAAVAFPTFDFIPN